MYDNKILLNQFTKILKSQIDRLNLVSSAETEREVEGGFFLDVVIGEGSSVLELLPGKDKPLLIRGNPLLVLDLGLNVLVLLYGVGMLNL